MMHPLHSIALSCDSQGTVPKGLFFPCAGSRDTTVKLWDPATCECIQTLQGHKYQVRSYICHAWQINAYCMVFSLT